MKWAERITAILLLALSVLWIKLAVNLPFPAFARAAKMGPGHYPIAVAVLLGILAVILFWQTFRSETHTGQPKDDEEQDRDTHGWRRSGFHRVRLLFCAPDRQVQLLAEWSAGTGNSGFAVDRF
jgi:hypothetical protein